MKGLLSVHQQCISRLEAESTLVSSYITTNEKGVEKPPD